MKKEKKLSSVNWEEIISRPKHYTQGSIEPVDYITANGLDFCEGNIVKYVTRHRLKNGKEDLLKAEFYIRRLIEDYDKS